MAVLHSGEQVFGLWVVHAGLVELLNGVLKGTEPSFAKFPSPVHFFSAFTHTSECKINNVFKDRLLAEYAVSVSDDKQSYGFHTAFGVWPCGETCF